MIAQICTMEENKHLCIMVCQLINCYVCPCMCAHVFMNICLGTCCITLLPLNFVRDFSKKSKFKELFDIAYFSNRYVHVQEYYTAYILSPIV